MQDLKSRCDITDIISSYVSLKRAAKHGGTVSLPQRKSPSSTSARRITRLRLRRGRRHHIHPGQKKISRLHQAVKMLADRVGCKCRSRAWTIPGRLRQRVLEISRESARFPQRFLGPEVSRGSYFARRRLPMKMIAHFGLGWAPKPLCARQSLRSRFLPRREMMRRTSRWRRAPAARWIVSTHASCFLSLICAATWSRSASFV